MSFSGLVSWRHIFGVIKGGLIESGLIRAGGGVIFNSSYKFFTNGPLHPLFIVSIEKWMLATSKVDSHWSAIMSATSYLSSGSVSNPGISFPFGFLQKGQNSTDF